jgi:sugar phosphate isomerase/epimerase
MARLGYDGVELAVRDPQHLAASHVRETLDRLVLEAPAIGTGQAYVEEGLSFTDPDENTRRRAMERIKEHIELARCLDALVIVGLLRGKLHKGTARETALGWLTDALMECAQYASPDVRLVIEPLNRYETNLINTINEGLELIAQVGADNVGLLFDTFHANIEESSMEEAIRAAGSRLMHVHVADSNRWYPGAGHLDFENVVNTLREIGYSGYLSVEIMPQPDAATCAERSHENLRRFRG